MTFFTIDFLIFFNSQNYHLLPNKIYAYNQKYWTINLQIILFSFTYVIAISVSTLKSLTFLNIICLVNLLKYLLQLHIICTLYIIVKIFEMTKRTELHVVIMDICDLEQINKRSVLDLSHWLKPGNGIESHDGVMVITRFHIKAEYFIFGAIWTTHCDCTI